MSENVIYFPSMQVPQNAWFYQNLLYWDNIYSIIPNSQWNHVKSENNRYMENLSKNGLLTVINPSDYSYYYVTDSTVYDNFLEYIDLVPNLHDIRSKTKIHVDKMDRFEFLPELRKRGLVGSETGDWIEINEFVANQYMAFLAGSLSELKDATPITDLISKMVVKAPRYDFNSDHFKEYCSSHDYNPNLERIEPRDILLEKLLPVPGKNVDLKDIANFKDKNFDELMNFRRKIEHHIIDILSTKDDLRAEKINFVLEDAQTEIDEITEKMEQSKLGKIISKNLFISSLPFISVPIALCLSIFNPMTLLSPLISGCISMKKIHDEKKFINNDISKNFYAYAVLANNDL